MLQKSIAVITYHDIKSNSIRPYKFRMADENGEHIAIKIDKIIWQTEERYMGADYLIYHCLCNVDDIQKTFVIRFNKSTCVWVLSKII